MRNLDHLDDWRIIVRGMGGDRYNGAFRLRIRPTNTRLYVIASDGGGWDHVSVSVTSGRRLPTWGEMAWVKDQFFDAEESVMQLHPPASQYVNNAEVLHLWRPQAQDIPLPPQWMVGLPGVTPEQMPALLASMR